MAWQQVCVSSSLCNLLPQSDTRNKCTIAINNAPLPTKETEKNKESLADTCAHMEHR